MSADVVKDKPKKDKPAQKKPAGKGPGGKPPAPPPVTDPQQKVVERRFDDPERVREFVEEKKHRSLVGLAWDTMGELQLKLLRDNGLQPEHKVLDIGCGCLRAGVKIIPYLEPDHYFGIDARQPLLNVGFKRELSRAGIDTRMNRENLYTSAVAEHARLPEDSIDAGLCIQVMTHYPLNFLRIMLLNAAKYFKSGAKLYVSFFEIPEDEPYAKPFLNKAGTRSRGHKPPYHYYRRDMEYMAQGTVWTPTYVGYWGEPDGQYLMVYQKA
jgi:SAM-dependent methyltransferase